MAFRFNLQALLRIRISYERLERLRLLAHIAIANRIRQEVAAVEAEVRNAQRELRSLLASGVPGGELLFAAAAERGRAARKKKLQELLAQAESRLEKQRKVLEARRRDRQILENLRERRLEEYHREQARREQKQVDELHLIHRSSTIREEGTE